MTAGIVTHARSAAFGRKKIIRMRIVIIIVVILVLVILVILVILLLLIVALKVVLRIVASYFGIFLMLHLIWSMKIVGQKKARNFFIQCNLTDLQCVFS